MKVRKLVAITLITTLIASGTTMISGAEVRGGEETTVQMTQITSDSNASLPENEIVDEVLLDDTTELLKATPSDATPSDATYVSTEEELREAVQTSGTVVVDGTIELSQPLYIRGRVELTLKDGNIAYSGKTIQNLITIGNAQVTLSNMKIDVTGMDWDKLTEVYDALWIQKDARVIMEEGTILMTDDPEDSLYSERKIGIWVDGELEMNNATVTGFSHGSGVAVERGATFILNEGEITHNYEGLSIMGGFAEIKGGLISNNINNGILNRGRLEMSEGEISHNWSGILNLDNDGISGEEFDPEAIVSGGTIFGNVECAIANKNSGIITVGGNADIEGVVEPTDVYRSKTTESKLYPVVSNSDNGTLKLGGGTITSHYENQIALLNDKTGKLEMTGGEIIAAGTAIKNENPSVGEVKLLSGKISLTSDQGLAIDNQGYMEATGDMEIEASNQYLIAVSHEPTPGGKLSSSTQMAKVGDVINITVTPNSGYKIADLIVDGVSKGAVSSYELTVSGNHSIIAKFEEKPSSGGSSGGGGGSSSGSSKVSTTSTPLIPETPGSWIQNETGWKFTQSDGTAYVNTWIRKSSQWYWVGADSYMVQGWTLINGVWYYLTPISGEMKTGWLDDNGIWYYLDKDGKKAVNTTTPDGYKVDANGAWIK